MPLLRMVYGIGELYPLLNSEIVTWSLGLKSIISIFLGVQKPYVTVGTIVQTFEIGCINRYNSSKND